MRNLNELNRQLKIYQYLYSRKMDRYINLAHFDKMNSDIVGKLNKLSYRIKNLYININQERQKIGKKELNRKEY